MHARTVCVIPGSGTGVNFTLHFVLFRFSQAIEMIGKNAFGIVVDYTQYLSDSFLMAEVIAIPILGIL